MTYETNNRYAVNPLMQLTVLSDADVKRIHDTSMKVLEGTGIQVESKLAAEIFEQGGARVDYNDDGALVKIPETLIEKCISAAPKKPTFFGRTEDSDFYAGKGSTGFSTFGECVKILDRASGEAIETRKEDLAGVTRICDYFDEIAVVERACGSLDFAPPIQPLHNFEAMVKNTSKAIFIGAVSKENARLMIDMARAVAGGDAQLRARPFLNLFVCPVSPLSMGKDGCEITIEAARAGVGVAVIPMALAGATSVVTLAGTAVNHNCEVLATLVLAQLAAAGTPFFYCSMSTIMDLKHMIATTGAPEHPLLGAAATKMANLYGLPIWIGAGVSDSKLPDAQAGYEFGIGTLLGALAGANILYGAGALESCLLIDYAKLVMDCEALGFIRRILDGIRVDDDTLALDIIAAKGPKGDFLREKHTFSHMREQTPTKVFDRFTRDTWIKNGARRADETAYARADEIRKEHRAAPLPEGAEEAMAKIIADRTKELGL